MRLKKLYSSREVAAMTGLSARQLQWWDANRLFASAIASHKTEAGGYTERRYTPLDVLELQALADLRHRGFTVGRLRALLETLRDVFGIRLYEAIGEGGPLTLVRRRRPDLRPRRRWPAVRPRHADAAAVDGGRGAAAAAGHGARAQAPPAPARPAVRKSGTPSRGRPPAAE